METRFYQTQEIIIPAIAQALELEYQAQGYLLHPYKGAVATVPVTVFEIINVAVEEK